MPGNNIPEKRDCTPTKCTLFYKNNLYKNSDAQIWKENKMMLMHSSYGRGSADYQVSSMSGMTEKNCGGLTE